ncbi:MAG: RNA polymerase factor sigma-32 [Deltaproteobacteria bacterium]|jgi:RNA polymerase sigma-32 factor|nr:RNA polymerase factor sigma-32 [Deltaproteobacteria bacterium]
MNPREKIDEIPMPLEEIPSLEEERNPTEDHEALEVFDPLKKYLMEVRKFPLLSREEELTLAKRWWEEKDRYAAYRLVVSNLRLVVKIAFAYQRAYTNLLDLIQEGNLGLMQAVKKFDPYREVKLSSYASWWIRAYILKFIIDNWSLVKVGTTQAQRKLFFRLRKEKNRLEAMGFDPGPKLLASHLDVTKEEVSEMEQRLEGGDLSLNAPLDADTHQTYLDILEGEETLEEKVAENQFKKAVDQRIEEFSRSLKDKEAFLLKHRLMAEDPLTLQAAGDQLHISRERARQIEKRVLSKLKVFLKEKFPDLDELQFTIKNRES